MKHASTRRLFDYWNERRGNRPAPERSEIDPGEIRHALGDTFMLAADFVDELRFRLAGTRICSLFCREIKGEAFAALWSEENRKSIADLIALVSNESMGAVADLSGRTTDGAELKMELLILPLAHIGHARIRALGTLVPLVPPFWLGEKPIVELDLGSLCLIGSEIENVASPLTTAATASRLRHGFAVYDGGRAAN